jgi:hypothetical protein
MPSMRLLPQKISVKSYLLGEVALYGSIFALIVPSFRNLTIQPSLICVLLKPRCTFNLPELILALLFALAFIAFAIFSVNYHRFASSDVSSKHSHALCILAGVDNALYLTGNLFSDLLDHLVGAITGGVFS